MTDQETGRPLRNICEINDRSYIINEINVHEPRIWSSFSKGVGLFPLKFTPTWIKGTSSKTVGY